MECKIMTLWLHHLLLNFSSEQFSSFMDFTSKLDVEQSLFPFPDGEERLVLRTPHQDICFSFTLEEWDNFQEVMGEAAYMKDIYQLING